MSNHEPERNYSHDPTTSSIEVVLLDALRGRGIDTRWTNYDDEDVWLGPAFNATGERIGITDCCLVIDPCDYHTACEATEVLADHQIDLDWDKVLDEQVYRCLGLGCRFETRDFLASRRHLVNVVLNVMGQRRGAVTCPLERGRFGFPHISSPPGEDA